MKFRIPIEFKERRRYVCVKHPEGYRLSDSIKEVLMKLCGMKCLSYDRFIVIKMNKTSSIIRTSEDSVKAVLTTLLFLKYTDCAGIEVLGVSGNMRKAREVCSRERREAAGDQGSKQ